MERGNTIVRKNTTGGIEVSHEGVLKVGVGTRGFESLAGKFCIAGYNSEGFVVSLTPLTLTPEESKMPDTDIIKLAKQTFL